MSATDDLWWTRACGNAHVGMGRLQQPFSVELSGAAWSIATDGRRLIAVPGDGFDESPFPTPDFLFKKPAHSARRCRLSDLRDWCRCGPNAATCARCGRAVGEKHKIRECMDATPVTVWDCTATGIFATINANRCGIVEEACVNRVALADTLAEAPGVFVKVEITGAEDPVRIFGDEWIAVHMPIRYSGDSVKARFTKWSRK